MNFFNLNHSSSLNDISTSIPISKCVCIHNCVQKSSLKTRFYQSKEGWSLG